MIRAAAVVAALLLWPQLAPAQRPDAEVVPIVVETTRLTPDAVSVSADGEVRFDNRSHRPIHVEFLDESGHHHLFEVASSIGAVFHRVGRHPFVVHFRDGTRRELHGVVNVVEIPRRGPELPVCGWITVEGNCLAP